MTFHSDHFGPLTADEQSAIEFPAGLPGFDDCRRFTILRHPEHDGLVFLQSLESASLCFLAVSVAALRPDYRLAMADEDRDLIGLASDEQALALAILSLVKDEEPTANLLAPVVIHTGSRRAVQAIRPDGLYSCREPLLLGVASCS